MKKLTILTLCVIAVFSACKKTEAPVDARDQFVGTWFGVMAMKINQTSLYLETLYIISKTVDSTDGITASNPIDKTILYKATVKGKTLTFDTFSQSEKINEKKLTLTFSDGTGAIAGGASLTGNGKFVYTEDGKSYEGTWKAIWAKQ